MNTPNLPRRFLQVPHIEIVDEIYRSTCHAPKFCLVVPSTVTINYRSIENETDEFSVIGYGGSYGTSETGLVGAFTFVNVPT